MASRFASPSESPGFLFWRATLAWQRKIAAGLRPLELTHTQFVLLAVLWWLGETGAPAPTQRALATQAGLDEMMTSQVLRALEARGLVDRVADEDDARARRPRITRAGAALLKKAIVVVEEIDRQFFARVDTPALLALLRPLVES